MVVAPRVGSTRDCLRRSTLGHGSKGGSHNPGGEGGGGGGDGVGSGSGQGGFLSVAFVGSPASP